MKTFDLQSVEIRAPFPRVFGYVADPGNLPQWTAAFKRADARSATLETPNGTVEIGLEVCASLKQGTVDWSLRFPDGNVARAFSRLIEAEENRTIYTFVLMPPPVPLEQLEGALEQQSQTLLEELSRLRQILE